MRCVAAVRGDLTCGFPYKNRYICSVRLGTFPLCSNLVCSPRAAGRQVGSWRFEGDESPWHDDVHVPVLGAVVLPKVSMTESKCSKETAFLHDSILRCRGRLIEHPRVHVFSPACTLVRAASYYSEKALSCHLVQPFQTGEDREAASSIAIQHAVKNGSLRL